MPRTGHRTGIAISCSLLYLLGLAAAPALAEERLYDRDVEKLIDRANNDLGKFLGNLDSEAKRAKVTRAGVETDVSDFMDDFKAEGRRLEERFGGDAAASPTALAFLQKAKALDGFLDRHPGFGGADKQWAALRPTLVSLAGAYQIDWAGDPETWRPVRTTDAEVAGWAKQLDQDIKGYASGLSQAAKDAKLDSTARKALDSQAKALVGGAKALQKAISSRSPASNALGSLVSGVNGVSEKAASLGLGSAAVDAAAPLQATLGKLSTAIGS